MAVVDPYISNQAPAAAAPTDYSSISGGIGSLFQGLGQIYNAFHANDMANIQADLYGLDAAAAKRRGNAIRLQAEFQKQQYDFNAVMADFQAEDTISRGETAATDHQVRTQGLIGSQRVAMAAQGIDIESGSAMEVQEDTASQSAMDVMTIRNNAWREAWGYKVQASDYRFKGQLAKFSGEFGVLQAQMDASAAEFTGQQQRSAGMNSLLTGGLDAAGSFAKAGYYGSKWGKS